MGGGLRQALAPPAAIWTLFVAGACLLAGCAGGGAAREKPPDQRYGHRYEGADQEGRVTLVITPPEPGQEYAYYDVPVSEVIVRAAPFEADEETVPAEVLIKGGLPNGCLQLHQAERERDGHFLFVDFIMRWPEGNAPCARFERHYRFYLPLPGRYAPGDYTLKLNGDVYPFSVRRSD